MKTAINNALVILGDGTYLHGGSVLLDGDCIAAIGTHPFEADQVIDAQGDALLPGFIDCHVHLGTKAFPNGAVSFGNQAQDEIGIRVMNQAQKFFKSGITSLRVVGTAYDADITLKKLARTGEIIVPRIQASGQVLCITTGHGYDMGVECDTVGEIVKAARNQIKKGADWLKMMPTSGVIGVGPSTEVQLSPEQIKAVCEVGRAFDKPTCAHIMNYNALLICIKAGLTCVEHGYDMDEAAAQMMVEQGTWFVPTGVVTLMESIMFDENDPDPSIKKMKKAAAQAQERSHQSMVTAIKAGVKMGVGTDSGCPFTGPDTYAYAKELELYVTSGMTEMDALTAATLKSAQLLRMDKEIGSLEVGKKADCVLIKGNPLENIKAVRDVRMTIQDGRICYKA